MISIDYGMMVDCPVCGEKMTFSADDVVRPYDWCDGCRDTAEMLINVDDDKFVNQARTFRTLLIGDPILKGMIALIGKMRDE